MNDMRTTGRPVVSRSTRLAMHAESLAADSGESIGWIADVSAGWRAGGEWGSGMEKVKTIFKGGWVAVISDPDVLGFFGFFGCGKLILKWR